MAIPSSDSVASASMASTIPVSLPSKKQEHLVAGRRKLEEYRKKKAGERKAEVDGGKNKKNDLTHENSSTLATAERLLQTRAEISSLEIYDAAHLNGNVQSNGEACEVSREHVAETQPSSGRIFPTVGCEGLGSEDDRWRTINGPLGQVNGELLGSDSSNDFRSTSSKLESGKFKLQDSGTSYSQTLLKVTDPVPRCESSSLSQDTIEAVSSVYKSGHTSDDRKDALLSSLNVEQTVGFGVSRNLGVKDFGKDKFVDHSSYGNFGSIGKLVDLSEQRIVNGIENTIDGDASPTISLTEKNLFEALHDSEVGSISVSDQKQAGGKTVTATPDVVPSHANLFRNYELGLDLSRKRYLSDVTYTSSNSEEARSVSKLNFEPQLPRFKTNPHLWDTGTNSSLRGSSEANLFPPLLSTFATQNSDLQSSLSLSVSTFSLPSSIPRIAPFSSSALSVPNNFPSSTQQSSLSTFSVPSFIPRDVSLPSTFLPPPHSFPLSTAEASATSLELVVGNSDKEESVPVSFPLSSTSVECSNRELESLETFGLQKWSQNKQEPSERDEFGALEQHIEDLTQEKFSLQRALDVARSLSESLASENSSLAQDFNQQGAIINQLTSDLERQGEEIRAQALVLSRFREERERAQQESNSAVERSQILAAEVIALEEKMLKLRSSELKLQRDLENLKGEHAFCKHQSSTLEKDRMNLRSMVEALQEEKKLMQNRLRKGDGFPDPNAFSKRIVDLRDQKDASTSTIDLVETFVPSYLGESQASPSTSLHEQPLHALPSVEQNDTNSVSITSSYGIQSSSMLPAPLSVSSDQLRTIENINFLITEFGKERDWTIKKLKTEITGAAKLRALNAELSQKLEMQTQRLELAIAQNMAHGRFPVGINVHEEAQDEVEYLDEGDEVVERVLGWIKRLFPGGSSKHRSSKLLRNNS